ncbi:hypothetical protein [Xenorhabdus bovienii]|uniref:hypothetical protein n=1 Tax=Xenorhabdus bovienii TaxID=40576 RepID=UPI0023B2DEEE|nr:hypothetical protein [Xenorhabdus bovienii]MDE9454543.1 hypothetical protein [Xenorhabdus bovienii]MDE9494376.1 hypothetical protein [Xenorhabdus bovienii]MDE9502815.1 hypothetical protein [Xenorhabdus bovienii]MDE9526430.1 hypothetical protein [Xenorhabdus bovienii]MDE9568780.1 hypothetical protein [Xenorhabdus bovienii]
MKRYFLTIGALLTMMFLLFFVTPTLFSAKSDFGVLGAIIVLFFVTPAVGVFGLKIFKKWSKK